MAQVFLSYAREDLKRAKGVAAALEKAGHSVWWDRHLVGGREYSAEIDAALAAADAIVVLWSKESVGSQWVRDEAAEGRDSGRLVPVLIDSTRPPIGFRQLQATDLSAWSGRGRSKPVRELIEAVRAKGKTTKLSSQSSPEVRSATVGWPVLRWAAVAAVAVALILVAWLAPPTRFDPRAETPTVAVLPFADLSPQSDKAFLGEGIAEEIRSQLGRESGLRVLGRSSSLQLHHSETDLRTVGKSLGVTHVLEGSARSFGDELRISVRLLDTSTGTELWSEAYQRDLRSIFAVQDEIARSVAEHLKITIGTPLARGKGQVTGSENYAIYLQARSKMRERKEGPMQEAHALARQLVTADPGYAPGHALLAEVTEMLSYDNYGKLPPRSAAAAALPHARRAVQLAPGAAEGHAALGFVLGHRPDLAVDPLQRAIRLDPARGELRLWLAISLSHLGRNSEALEHYRVLAEMEPLWQPAIALYSLSLAAAGRFDQAQALVDAFESRGGRPGEAAILRGRFAETRGDFSEAVRHVLKARHLDPQMSYTNQLLSWYYHLLGMDEPAAQLARAEPPYTRLAISRNEPALLAQSRRAGTAITTQPDSDVAVAALANARDWHTLSRLYDEWRHRVFEGCVDVGGGGVTAARQRSAMAPYQFAAALRHVGREQDSAELVQCLQRNLDRQSGGPIRYYALSEATLNFEQAQLHALRGESDAALQAISNAVESGWRGWYRPSLTAYPALDPLKSRTEYRQLEIRLQRLIERDRSELSQQQRS
jgi:adenylate cyclase